MKTGRLMPVAILCAIGTASICPLSTAAPMDGRSNNPAASSKADTLQLGVELRTAQRELTSCQGELAACATRVSDARDELEGLWRIASTRPMDNELTGLQKDATSRYQQALSELQLVQKKREDLQRRVEQLRLSLFGGLVMLER